MNHRLLRTLLLTAALIFVVDLAPAQRSGNTEPFQKPERLKLTGIGEPDPNVRWEDQKYITASFYPIGWSRDGKFAYLVVPADEACGCLTLHIFIQDLRTDRVVWKETYDGEAEPEIPETLDTAWPKVQNDYSAKLRQYGIEQADKFELIHPAIRLDNDVLTPEVTVAIETDGVFEVDGTVTVRMVSQRNGVKTISRNRYHRKDVNSIRNAEIAGSLISPFEKRAAVILIEEHRGYEGPPNVTRIRVVGSTLTTGFKK
ncbi:MAG TPA: hypothetical protein PKD24_11835 [Pyrinomonadaceae bacterium]|nr:hypothetical protein [Pyrinomonadaceae bacterium]HMP65938.1 hypothetical protein [Pyrinomonadaceae bacterium]